MAIEKQVFRSGPFAEFIAQGVKTGPILHLSGQVGMDDEGEIPESIIAQTELAYVNVATVLAEFGATLDNVVDETFFVTDIDEVHDHMEGIYGARAAAYGGQPEVTQTLIGTTALVLPGLKLEIKCVAIIN